MSIKKSPTKKSKKPLDITYWTIMGKADPEVYEYLDTIIKDPDDLEGLISWKQETKKTLENYILKNTDPKQIWFNVKTYVPKYYKPEIFMKYFNKLNEGKSVPKGELVFMAYFLEEFP
jgi:hypothetical protein